MIGDTDTKKIAPAVALLGLGERRSLVAGALARAGVRGRRKCMSTCIIAVYLGGLGYTGVSVFAHPDGEGLVVLADGWAGWTVPRPVAEFVKAFDDGEYPHLVEEA
jgi:hypothetical protein